MSATCRLIRSAAQAAFVRRSRDEVRDIVAGPHSTLRSELLEVMHRG